MFLFAICRAVVTAMKVSVLMLLALMALGFVSSIVRTIAG